MQVVSYFAVFIIKPLTKVKMRLAGLEIQGLFCQPLALFITSCTLSSMGMQLCLWIVCINTNLHGALTWQHLVSSWFEAVAHEP